MASCSGWGCRVAGRVLRVRRGRSPNCSSAGSVVGLALASAVAGAAAINAFAGAFLEWREGSPRPGPGTGSGKGAAGEGPGAPVRIRREGFGGIVAWPSPPALLYVDGEAAAEALGAGAVEVGEAAPARVAGALRAPTEVHLAVTSRCPARCSGCYLSAGPEPSGGEDPDGKGLRGALAQLAALGVFEVAFGGGEAGLRDDLLDLAREARDLGMVPNLTTSGFGLTAERARRMAGLFGQVNVSLDGLGADYEAVRGWDGTGIALSALERLGEAGVRAGVNTVLTRANFRSLPEMGGALAARGVAEWQWLRLKPAGRGAQVYETMALSEDEALALWPRALAVEAATGLVMRFDCALVPFLAAHRLPQDHLRCLGVEGCVGGHSLWSRAASGGYAPCSFVSPGAGGAAEAGEIWATDPVLHAWRRRAEDPPEPCASCDHREVCRGGCRVVAGHLARDAMAPDPECSRVRRWARVAT